MKIYVKSLNGDTYSVDVESVAEIGNVRKHLKKEGVSIAQEKPLIVSLNVFNPELDLLDAPLPPVPKPQNPDDMPSKTSVKILVASNPDEKLSLRLGDSNLYLRLESFRNIDPPIPPYTLRYNRYWQMADFQRIDGPQGFKYSATTTEGMSQTDTETWSGEMGVSINGLSGKLTDTFSHSITISSSTSVTHDYHIDVPSGKVGIWILWQLIDEVVAVDQSGNQIQYRGTGDNGFFTAPVVVASSKATQGTSAYNADVTLF